MRNVNESMNILKSVYVLIKLLFINTIKQLV